jgi:hypothetical protein
MRKYSIRLLSILVFQTASLATMQSPPLVSVSGCTYEITDSGTYHTLNGVEVVVKRQGPVTKKPEVSGSPGRGPGEFRLLVPEGTPFFVLFYENQKVPELQQLAGLGNLSNHVNVTLLTVQQYKTLRGGVPRLKSKLSYIL